MYIISRDRPRPWWRSADCFPRRFRHAMAIIKFVKRGRRNDTRHPNDFSSLWYHLYYKRIDDLYLWFSIFFKNAVRSSWYFHSSWPHFYFLVDLFHSSYRSLNYMIFGLTICLYNKIKNKVFHKISWIHLVNKKWPIQNSVAHQRIYVVLLLSVLIDVLFCDVHYVWNIHSMSGCEAVQCPR